MTLSPYLLIGLGNPGREYRDTRHNIGFMLVDHLAERIGARGMKVQSKAITTSALYEEHRIILAKPQTYMNLSGQSVQGLLHFYKIPTTNLLIAHDDLDIPFGTLRIRPTGGPGGQRGMANTIELLGTKDFPRLRLGIGRPPGRMDPKDYVLQNFSKDDAKLLPEVLSRAADAALEFVMNGLNAAMNKYNGAVE
ncbi:MAG: aminoacyl-tRNA hydrolase [Anaerolineales bacterium]|nr:aminoacyl-tRNA hydrolase [Anaerolineales bacterium]